MADPLRYSPEFLAWAVVYSKAGGNNDAAMVILADRVVGSFVSTPKEALVCALRAMEDNKPWGLDCDIAAMSYTGDVSQQTQNQHPIARRRVHSRDFGSRHPCDRRSVV
jgi:hypothetical protein